MHFKEFSSINSAYFVLIQAEAKEKERVKEEFKRFKKLEMQFKSLLKEMNIDPENSWDEVKEKVQNEEEYLAFASDSERQKIYKVRHIYYFWIIEEIILV